MRRPFSVRRLEIMPNTPDKMSDEFWQTIDEFMNVAKRLEGRLSQSQIHSAFMYASASYSAKFLANPKIQHRKTTEHLMVEYADMYSDMLKTGFKHYNDKPSA